MKDISFELSSITLSGISFGDETKPLIIACHGWLDNAMSFYPLSEYLTHYHVIAFDFAGHGKSSHRSKGAHYHFVDYVQDLHELISQQGWKNFILMGHSMGGMVCSMYAACFPEYVRQLICLESFGPLTDQAQNSTQQLRAAIESRLSVIQTQVKHPASLEHAVAARIKVSDMSRGSATLLMERNVECNERGCFWRTDRRLRTLSSLRLTDEQARSFMCNIKAPVLIVKGESGYDFMLTYQRQRSQWIAQLDYQECEGGHHFHMDNPENVAKLILNFLTK